MIAKLARYPRVTFYIPLSSPILVGLLLLTRSVCTEEEDIWKDAIVTSPFGRLSICSPLDALVHTTTFKDLVHTNDNTANQYFTIDQGESLKRIRIYIQNRSDLGWDRFGNLHICIGNDPSSPTASGNTCSTESIHDGGIIILDLPAGRYIYLDRRDKA